MLDLFMGLVLDVRLNAFPVTLGRKHDFHSRVDLPMPTVQERRPLPAWGRHLQGSRTIQPVSAVGSRPVQVIDALDRLPPPQIYDKSAS